MPSLALERCFHHETREAVCRCPECRRFFCRECVVPFDGRLLCATCIARANEPPLISEKRSSSSGQMLLGVAALVFIWIAYYCLGWMILQYRDSQPVEVAERGPLFCAPSLSESRHCLSQNQNSSAEPRALASGFRLFLLTPLRFSSAPLSSLLGIS
jgi:hypothetical protein